MKLPPIFSLKIQIMVTVLVESLENDIGFAKRFEERHREQDVQFEEEDHCEDYFISMWSCLSVAQKQSWQVRRFTSATEAILADSRVHFCQGICFCYSFTGSPLPQKPSLHRFTHSLLPHRPLRQVHAFTSATEASEAGSNIHFCHRGH